MRDYRVGEVKSPKIELAVAVGASSAFPPVLSPVELDLKESDYTPDSGYDLQRPPFTTQVVLCDGGVYDNLGLETAWKRYKTILVSDGGGVYGAEEDPKRDWLNHTIRVMDLIDNQVRALRKRQIMASFHQPRSQRGVLGHLDRHNSLRTTECPPLSQGENRQAGEHLDSPGGLGFGYSGKAD